MIRRSVMVLGALALFGGTVACGGGDDDAADGTGDERTSAEVDADTEATGDVADGKDDGEADRASESDGDAADQDGTPAASDGGFAVPKFTGQGGEDFCEAMLAVQTRAAESGEPSTALGDMLDQLAEIDPPDELADQWRTFFEIQSRLTGADGTIDPAAAGTLEPAENRAFTEASLHVSSYLEQVCET